MPDIPCREPDPVPGLSEEIKEQKLAIFLPSFEKGGVERMMVNLARGFTDLGYYPDFVVRNAGSPYLKTLPDEAKLVELDSIHRDPETAAALYLERSVPSAVLTSKEENDEIAIRAKERSGAGTRIVVRVPVHVTSRLMNKRRGPIKTWSTYRKLKKTLWKADAIVAVSHGVALDISAITGIPEERICVIRNPVITPDLEGMAAEETGHEWLGDRKIPVLLGIGRLGRQKNFELLIKAFARVVSERECRLIILGEGRRRERLKRLVRKLNLEASVDLPGFVTNPYGYLSRSSLFVLSSNWEGSPNALTEALALGVPVVSTDCDSGPREILNRGQYGRLVPVNNQHLMEEAICATLLNPVKTEILREAVREYTLELSSRRYLSVLTDN